MGEVKVAVGSGGSRDGQCLWKIWEWNMVLPTWSSCSLPCHPFKEILQS